MPIGFYDRCLRVLDDLEEIDRLHHNRLLLGESGPRPEAEAMQSFVAELEELGWLDNLHEDCSRDPEHYAERQAEPDQQED